MGSSALPGWYADPRGTGVRYWDGSAWTHEASAAVASARAAPPVRPVSARPGDPNYWPQLESEKVVVSAPLSFHGSAARIWKITKTATGAAQAGLIALAILLVVLAWSFVLTWYMVWGLWLVPYRVIRRGSRKRKVDALRHRELIAAMQAEQRRR